MAWPTDATLIGKTSWRTATDAGAAWWYYNGKIKLLVYLIFMVLINKFRVENRRRSMSRERRRGKKTPKEKAMNYVHAGW